MPKIFIFFKKIANGNFLRRMKILAIFFEGVSSFWQFFDSQMAIFRRVRFISRFNIRETILKLHSKNEIGVTLDTCIENGRKVSHEIKSVHILFTNLLNAVYHRQIGLCPFVQLISVRLLYIAI